ncbi:MAG: protein-L-isoaspartate O-methyltransferase family protein [Candidatus Rariloculaceae bacterium]
MNLEEARTRMIAQQLRTWDVFDNQVLEAVRQSARELFVPKDYYDFAFADMEIPLAYNQYMMTPKVEGRLLQSLALKADEKILEVGTGSGFMTACLSHLSKTIVSIDIISEFTTDARQKLNHLNIKNVELHTKDVFDLNNNDQFDVIAITGSLPSIDEKLIQMLRPQWKNVCHCWSSPCDGGSADYEKYERRMDAGNSV